MLERKLQGLGPCYINNIQNLVVEGVFGNGRCNILLIGGFGDGRCYTLLHVIIIHSFWVNNTLICEFESNSSFHIYKWSKYQWKDDTEIESNINANLKEKLSMHYLSFVICIFNHYKILTYTLHHFYF